MATNYVEVFGMGDKDIYCKDKEARASIDGLTQKVNTVEQTANSAKSTADNAIQTANTANSTASSASTKADTAISTANAAKSTAQTASETATEAKSTADSAKSTADSAKTTASSANNTANTAKSTADTAKSTADSALSKANAAQDDINKSKIGKLDFRRTVIIGDSFVQGYGLDTPSTQNFAKKFANIMGISDCQIFGGGGIGFVHKSASLNMTALQYFDSIKSDISSPSTVTFVLVCLGWNDKDADTGSINGAVNTFFSNLKSYMPNADIAFMVNPGYSCIRKQIFEAIELAVISSNIININSYFWMLLQDRYFQSDFVHPNSAGHIRIASCLRSVLSGGTIYNYAIVTGMGESGFNATLTVVNEICYLYINGTKNADERATKVATWPAKCFHGNNNNDKPVLRGRLVLPLGDNQYNLGFIQWSENQNQIYCCSFAEINNTGAFADGSFTCQYMIPALLLLG